MPGCARRFVIIPCFSSQYFYLLQHRKRSHGKLSICGQQGPTQAAQQPTCPFAHGPASQLWVARHGPAQALGGLHLRSALLPPEAVGAGQAGAGAEGLGRGAGRRDAAVGAREAGGRGGQGSGAAGAGSCSGWLGARYVCVRVGGGNKRRRSYVPLIGKLQTGRQQMFRHAQPGLTTAGACLPAVKAHLAQTLPAGSLSSAGRSHCLRVTGERGARRQLR